MPRLDGSADILTLTVVVSSIPMVIAVKNVCTKPMIEVWMYFYVPTLESTVGTAVGAIYCNI